LRVGGDLHLQGTPRAHPVADAPVDALLARADELARRWAIALILARPLNRIGEVPLEDLAREGPALCAQAARALRSDAELERLAGTRAAGDHEESAPALRLGALAGARDGGDLVLAVEALRGVLWESLLQELGRPMFDSSAARGVAELGDRLAYVCATALAAALTQTPSMSESEPDGARGERGKVVYESESTHHGRRGAVLIDEGPAVAASRAAGSGGVTTVAPAEAPWTSKGRRTQPRPLPWDTPLRTDREGGPREGGPPSQIAVLDGLDAGAGREMRARRGPGAPLDGRPDGGG
jgi:hypothetical protein